MLAEKLDIYLQDLDFTISDVQKNQLLALVAALNKWNKAYNLTSVRDPKEMLSKHIMDSLVVSPYLQGESFIDVGTGPGLPGLPLAIINPDKQFVLLDSLGKRIRFIRQVVFELGLKNVTAVQSRVEDFQPDLPFSGVLSRAFASLTDMLHWCGHLTDENGGFFALKGQLTQALDETVPEGFKIDSIQSLSVPGLEGERHLVIINKLNTKIN